MMKRNAKIILAIAGFMLIAVVINLCTDVTDINYIVFVPTLFCLDMLHAVQEKRIELPTTGHSHPHRPRISSHRMPFPMGVVSFKRTMEPCRCRADSSRRVRLYPHKQ